ncbi:type I-B CRISPR-associated protein Cas8b1/Cst1 [Persephonella sp. KM09-Lau-8]|uniref:type I-B CRISPR-associated protein Cas8b1/Cst1 n=1 Tax=Persephonella sp. KM09-Lau-8 TaxID=1158345 RepID=UPI00049574E2|nr:type I-B CRISPR-associated protein Cas8b1/Cst1 [Persephonella sp. KM09-Lau-8]
MEKVYLGDWLYNAGIVGFLNINSHLWEIKDKRLVSKNENLLKFGDNYIEFDRKIFDGFAERFFDYAFNQYGRYENLLKLFEEYIEDLNNSEDIENFEKLNKKYFQGKLKDNKELEDKLPIEIFDRFKKILSGFTLLKKKLKKLPSKNEIKKNKSSLGESLQKAIKIMKENKEEFWESDVQIYLRNIYGQKSFLNLSVNKDRFKKFFEDFEEPLKENKVKKDSKYYCISCMERKAKKNTIFDTGISKFYGLNPDSINFIWNFNPKLPLCEICEIIYFSYFAGLTPVKKDDKTVYYFVNSDSSIDDLVRENQLLKNILTTEISENILLDFFTQIILESSYREAVYTLQNIAVLELDLTNETMPKVYSFNLSREKAQFLKETKNKEDLRKFSKNYYKIKDTKISILPEIMYLILENKFYFNYLNKLLKFYIATQNNSKNYETNITPHQLQVLNSLIFRFLTNVIGGRTMKISENDMWTIYYKGKGLADLLKSKNAENKIQSISYKLLNALRIGDTREFMDILIRTYMAYGEEIPSSFVKTLSDKETFYALGYSFLNGLLGEENQAKKQEEVNNNG